MQTSWTTLKSPDGGSFSGYVAVPSEPNGAALVILQEIFGVNQNIRGIVEGFAAAGFVAIAPDLFWRQQPNVSLDPAKESDRALAMTLLSGLNEPLAVMDSVCTADHVRQLSGSGARVGCVGYCLGGKLAFLLASRPEISCAVSYYGVQIQQCLDQARTISSPLLLHIAEQDHLCPSDAQAAIIEKLRGEASLATVMSHPGVGHGFARLGGGAFDAAATERANAATLALLRETLLSETRRVKG